MATKNQNEAAASDTTQDNATGQAEEQKSFAERMATMERPNKDTRYKTEDVTATEGFTFRDFNLADSVQFVSEHFDTFKFFLANIACLLVL